MWVNVPFSILTSDWVTAVLTPSAPTRPPPSSLHRHPIAIWLVRLAALTSVAQHGESTSTLNPHRPLALVRGPCRAVFLMEHRGL